ncbi:hypothetical protein [Modestobacter sp. VKM Ac-2985]|uniref:hypothetical protein n=1 Tax=Modestobacter sp. VKM Ac-2985 TaxID=3004139 RepID=UPI0022ABC172|nr:hypothetical protein [Modestobacter sp. VKM Ac-2985]MCZ2836558.1 hypothetical protein [Modestobacter sp. VKM Ac-2985]
MVAFADVVDWVDGKLDGPAAARVQAAVETDPGLRAAADWFRAFRAQAQRMPLSAPPERVRDTLMKRFAAYRPPPPGLLERVRAVISFDSATAQLALGVRAADTGTVRHLVVESPVVDIALDLYPEDRTVRVEGQVLPGDPDVPGLGTIRLIAADSELATASSDENGRFALPPVPPGEVLFSAAVAGVLVEVDLLLQA